MGLPLPRTQVVGRNTGAPLQREPGSERVSALPNGSLSQSRMADPSQGGQVQHKDLSWEELMLRNYSLSVGYYYSLSIRNSNLTGHPLSSYNSGS